MKLNIGNPHSSPFRKGGLYSLRELERKNLFPSFLKRGEGRLLTMNIYDK